ncbi:hypothetical protein V8G54_009362, partial [Vigna mungo]
FFSDLFFFSLLRLSSIFHPTSPSSLNPTFSSTVSFNPYGLPPKTENVVATTANPFYTRRRTLQATRYLQRQARRHPLRPCPQAQSASAAPLLQGGHRHLIKYFGVVFILNASQTVVSSMGQFID